MIVGGVSAMYTTPCDMLHTGCQNLLRLMDFWYKLLNIYKIQLTKYPW